MLVVSLLGAAVPVAPAGPAVPVPALPALASFRSTLRNRSTSARNASLPCKRKHWVRELHVRRSATNADVRSWSHD